MVWYDGGLGYCNGRCGKECEGGLAGVGRMG